MRYRDQQAATDGHPKLQRQHHVRHIDGKNDEVHGSRHPVYLALQGHRVKDGRQTVEQHNDVRHKHEEATRRVVPVDDAE